MELVEFVRCHNPKGPLIRLLSVVIVLILAVCIQIIYFPCIMLFKPFIGKKGVYYIKSFIMVFLMCMLYFYRVNIFDLFVS